MELVSAVLKVHESPDPSSAFRAMADALRASLPLRFAVHIAASNRAVRECWPEPMELTPDLIDAALHVFRPEVFPLGSEFPAESARFQQADMLILPLRRGDEARSACILIADSGSFGEDLQPWEQLARAIEHLEARHERVAAAEARCTELQRRVEESEALHTLGLAANRTLDIGEVLNLVARFTRTLLGAHYVTVNTLEGGRVYTVASVGLRDPARANDDYHLARSVVGAEKPVTIGGSEANLQVEHFPFHQAEGMVSGLGLPLSLFGDTFGALVVGYRREYPVQPRDIRLALTLAGHVAVAISNARLHEQVEQRSEELARAYGELSEISRAKERFFASINHELRNPLNAVINYQEILLEEAAGQLSDQSRHFLQKAHRAAATLGTLVNDLLDLSKIAAGKMTLNVRECALAEILDGVVNTIQPLADELGVTVRLPPADTLPTLRTDPDRAQQILVNIGSNAVKFTRGEVRVVVNSPSDAPENTGSSRGIEIQVIDSGPGIAPDDLKRVFEEYEQVKGTRGGTGLGLPISRRLARLLGGDLRAESEMGVGSTFVLQLPAHAEIAAAAVAPREATEASSPPHP